MIISHLYLTISDICRCLGPGETMQSSTFVMILRFMRYKLSHSVHKPHKHLIIFVKNVHQNFHWYNFKLFLLKLISLVIIWTKIRVTILQYKHNKIIVRNSSDEEEWIYICMEVSVYLAFEWCRPWLIIQSFTFWHKVRLLLISSLFFLSFFLSFFLPPFLPSFLFPFLSFVFIFSFLTAQ